MLHYISIHLLPIITVQNLCYEKPCLKCMILSAGHIYQRTQQGTRRGGNIQCREFPSHCSQSQWDSYLKQRRDLGLFSQFCKQNNVQLSKELSSVSRVAVFSVCIQQLTNKTEDNSIISHDESLSFFVLSLEEE